MPQDGAAECNVAFIGYSPGEGIGWLGVVDGQPPIRVLLKGTNFQIKVWEALLKIPAGAAVSYGALAEAAGRPGAGRAVGTAVGRNPIAYLIPCHRVLRSNGAVGGYRWGTARKKAMLGYESRHK